MKISGDVLIDQLIPRVAAGSCLKVKLQNKCKEEKCESEALAEIVQRNIVVPPSNRIYYQIIIKPRPAPGIYIISAVLNRGWCAGDKDSTEWLRIGDYVNVFRKEIQISETGDIEKDVVIMQFLPKDGIKYNELNLANIYYVTHPGYFLELYLNIAR